MSAVITGLLYCIVGQLLYPTVSVAGSSGWCFTFFGYFAVLESHIRPRYAIGGSGFGIPTIMTPLVLLLVIAVLIPGSSFWGHLFGLIIGYAVGLKEPWVHKLLPPGWIITKIESNFDALIALIPFGVKYYKDEEVNRDESYQSLFGGEDGLPLVSDNVTASRSEGRVLGTN